MFSQKQDAIEAISPNLYWDPRFEIEAAKILPGEFYVTEQHKMVVTVLGSAVCACVRDRAKGIGGMSHFMLADRGRDAKNPDSQAAKYGVYAMEMLIEQLMRAGAQRRNLEAKIFGGAKLLQHGSGPDIGKLTSDFLINHLKSQKIKIAAKSMGGSYPRKVYYFPRTGLVLVRRLLKANNNTILDREKEYRINLDAWV